MRQSQQLLPPLSVNYSDLERRNTLHRERNTTAPVIVAHQISSQTCVRRSLLSTCAATQINVISAWSSLYEALFKAFASQPQIWQQQLKLRACAIPLVSLIVRKPKLVSERSKI